VSNLVFIYCDESCHLEHDGQHAMVLGALSCPASIRQKLGRRIKDLKRKHQVPAGREIKWTQVSPSRLGFYLDLVELFFEEPTVGFRAVVVPDKQALDHASFDQCHDDFYYKMWWQLLTRWIDDQHRYRIFVDIKDTKSAEKLTKLHDVLCNAHYDFDRSCILSIDAVESDQVPQLQLSDLLIGAVSHLHRGLTSSPAKTSVIDAIKARTGLSLVRSTLPSARKFNLFVWRPQVLT
jgi:hypothetical protein